MFAKIAPGLNSKSPRSWLKTLTPVTSVGSRSGVNWIRRNEQSIERAIALASIVLPTPGTSSIRRCPSATSAASASRISGCLPWTTFSTFCSMTRKPSANRCQSSVGSRASNCTSGDRRRTILLRSTSRVGPGFLRHPAQADGRVGPRRGKVMEAAAAHPLPDAPRGPLFALPGVLRARPSAASARITTLGFGRCKHLRVLRALETPRILAPWDEHSCSTRRTSHSRWWLRDGP